MSPERWGEVERIYHSALSCQTGELSAFLINACGGDESLRSEVESLLAANDKAGAFLDPRALDGQLRDLSAGAAAIQPGKMVGTYQVVSQIGAGGMGQVYLANDASLDRKVAVKLLHSRFTGDSGWHARFVREAKSASALNHPNIITVYQIGEAQGLPFIVTEFVGGETLRRRISRGPMQADEVVRIARQCAAALEAAHEAGIVHRDIKPENIMLRPDGLVKVLDFGLARTSATAYDALPGAASADPTVTVAGAVLGTPNYMSPEQARGDAVDVRTDLFSLGAVIYEMITGKAPLTGKNSTEVISTLLASGPLPLVERLPGTPAALEDLIRRCLKKDRARRFQTAADLLRALDRLAPESSAPTRRKTRRVSAAIAAMIAGTAVGLYLWTDGRTALPPTRAVPLTSFPGNIDHAAFSPDGTKVAFCWDGAKPERIGHRNIYIKTIPDGEPVRLTFGDMDERMPSWSPDGKQLAFERTGNRLNELMVVPVAGGAPRKLANSGTGLSWSPDGSEIAFVAPYPPDGNGGIMALSLATGRVRELTNPKPLAEGLVAWSPDGKKIAFTRSLTRSAREIYVIPSHGGTAKRLTFDRRPTEGCAWTADSRDLVFVSPRFGGPNLWRISAAGGQPERVVSMAHHPTMPAVSRVGNRLAFTEVFNDSNIWEYDRSGIGGLFGSPRCLICSTFEDDSPQFSPDGSKVAFVSKRTGSDEIWVAERDGSHPTQLTFIQGAPTGTPRWSPDGHWIAFDSRVDGSPDIYVMSAQGGPRRRLTFESSSEFMPNWSADGKWIYFISDRGDDQHIWKVPFEGGAAVQVSRSHASEAAESPDGKRLYYFRHDHQNGIWTVPVEGGDGEVVPELSDVPETRGWAMRPEGIYFFRKDSAGKPSLRFFSFSTRKVVTILTPEHSPSYVNPSLAISPDGKVLLYSQVDHRVDDLMMIENFR